MILENDLLKDFIEVELKNKDDFLKIAETLTRIGVVSSTKKELFQSCHVLHKKGKYYIVSFKEMFWLDGKPSDFSDEDKLRRNRIAKLLEEWGLIKILDPSKIDDTAPLNKIKIIPFKEKNEYILTKKYTIGKKKNGVI